VARLHFLDGPLQNRVRPLKADAPPEAHTALLNRGTAACPDVIMVYYVRVGGYGATGLYSARRQQSTPQSQTRVPPLWLYE